MSYGQISKKLTIAKSTAKLWTGAIQLSERDKLRLYTNTIQNLNLGSQSQKARRQKEVEKIVSTASAEIITPLSFNELRLAGAMLYWGEGNKGNDCRFTNSDPAYVIFIVNWFQKVFNTPPSSLRANLNIHSGQNEKEIRQFWSETTGIPLENFGLTYIKQKSRGYKKNTLYYGTIQVRVPKSADLVQKINGWVLGATRPWVNTLAKQKQKWYSLRHYMRS